MYSCFFFNLNPFPVFSSFHRFRSVFCQFELCNLQSFLVYKARKTFRHKVQTCQSWEICCWICWCVFFSIMCKVRVDWLLWVRLERPWHAEYVSFFFTYMDPHSVYDYNCFRWLPQTISTFPLWYGEKSLIKFSRTHSYTSCHVQWNLKV